MSAMVLLLGSLSTVETRCNGVLWVMLEQNQCSAEVRKLPIPGAKGSSGQAGHQE